MTKLLKLSNGSRKRGFAGMTVLSFPSSASPPSSPRRKKSSGSLSSARSLPRRNVFVLACVVVSCFIAYSLCASTVDLRGQSGAFDDPQIHRLQVLCTSSPRQMTWGSFKIRCEDFQKFTKKYYPKAKVDFHILPAANLHKKVTKPFDATIIIKEKFAYKPLYGKRVLVDVIDDYRLHQPGWIPADYEVVVQNKFQAMEFTNRTTHIVPHWFNSFPADDQEDPPADTFMEIEPLEDKTMRALTVWTTGPGDTCFNFTRPGFDYQCIDGFYDISRWYVNYAIGDPPNFMKNTISDPTKGAGYLYRHLFRKYHVLVLYPKGGLKLKFNSLQRVASQMRSGVPVLLSCLGENHNYICEKYKYPCVFHDEASFQAMMEKMRDVKLRQECQRIGIEITRTYHSKCLCQCHCHFCHYV